MTTLNHSCHRTRRSFSNSAQLGLALVLLAGCGGSRDPITNKSTSPNTTHASAGQANLGSGGTIGSGGAGGATIATAGSAASAGTRAASSTVATGGAFTVTAVGYAGAAGALTAIKPAWDWNGIVGTGQSLAVGNSPIISKVQFYHNLMLSLGTAVIPPWDAAVDGLASMVPLVERLNKTSYPAPYPTNLWGETPHTSMANQISAMVQYDSGGDYVTVHTIVGESGQGIDALKKQTGDTTGKTGRAYAATLFEAQTITRLAQAARKTYGIGAIVMTHGETDSGSAGYKSELVKLLQDYNTDLAAITGQTTPIPMFLSQQFAYPDTPGQRPQANQFQWQLGVERPGSFVCTGPKYQYPGHGDSIHLSSVGYMQLGEKTGQVYYERVVLGHDWQPLQPIVATKSGRVISVKFHVPVPPLTWETTYPAPTTDWPDGKGFEVRAGSNSVGISSVEIADDTVNITCSSDLPATGVTVSYAMTSGTTPMTVASKSRRWGLLRDSDPFVGATTQTPQPNYAVAFDLSVSAQ